MAEEWQRPQKKTQLHVGISLRDSKLMTGQLIFPYFNPWMYWFTLVVYSIWLCNVVAMFSYANILFSKLLMVTCLSPKSCLTFCNSSLVAYKLVAYKKVHMFTILLWLSFATNMAEAKLNRKIQKKVATRAAFIKVVKNILVELNSIYNDYKHERRYEELLSCQELKRSW